LLQVYYSKIPEIAFRIAVKNSVLSGRPVQNRFSAARQLLKFITPKSLTILRCVNNLLKAEKVLYIMGIQL
jgi:hypothetical protein